MKCTATHQECLPYLQKLKKAFMHNLPCTQLPLLPPKPDSMGQDHAKPNVHTYFKWLDSVQNQFDEQNLTSISNQIMYWANDQYCKCSECYSIWNCRSTIMLLLLQKLRTDGAENKRDKFYWHGLPTCYQVCHLPLNLPITHNGHVRRSARRSSQHDPNVIHFQTFFSPNLPKYWNQLFVF